jgi:hypothetical protein
LCLVLWKEFTDVSDVLPASTIRDLMMKAASIGALIMEVASISETSVNFYQTARRNNPEDSHLLTCRRENLKALVFTNFLNGSADELIKCCAEWLCH